jgi:hypothetical protein
MPTTASLVVAASSWSFDAELNDEFSCQWQSIVVVILVRLLQHGSIVRLVFGNDGVIVR